MSNSSRLRRQKLVNRGLQIRLTAKFVGLAVLSMSLQFLFLGYRLLGALEGVEGRGGDLAGELPGLMLETLAISLLLILPAMVVMGVMLTFRIAGPAHRLETYLNQVAEGAATSPCSIRDRDELQTLCEALNGALQPLLQSTGSPIPSGSEAANSDAAA